jgi:maleate cis-trans isomerase
MTVEYAPKGLLGVLTPQANTTVEPELAILMPRGTAWINGRLISEKPTIIGRLREYFASFEMSVQQFANAPVGAIAFACTGASYLAGTAEEDAKLAQLSERLRVPTFTAASAVVDALQTLKARRIGLVSPYDDELTTASVAYWQERGFTVAAKTSASNPDDAFHPIYSLPSGAAQAALDAMHGESLDAVVMLGTGMPTLAPIARTVRVGHAPVMSCMLCLAWRAACHLENRKPDRDDLLSWIAAGEWKSRLLSF